jgi:DNA-binding NtrC family response regulator
MSNIENIKQRFQIIGNSPLLKRSIQKALQVASADISVLITGESGTGKDIIPKVIHTQSSRKHGPLIAVNCGAIPEGTIDSELFGHEKGAFTGAINTRKGYFEEANNGTIFLDELGDLPLPTQARLLRVLENGEFIKVGSSKIQKTNVRIICATNINLKDAIQKNTFREDLFYRLSTIEIKMAALRDRKEDINLLFKKFSRDFCEKNRIPIINLTEDAIGRIQNYDWPGNIRELKNFAEKLAIIEEKRNLNAADINLYIPKKEKNPIIFNNQSHISEREILYKMLFEMKQDLNELREMTSIIYRKKEIFNGEMIEESITPNTNLSSTKIHTNELEPIKAEFEETVQENLSLETQELNIIKKALEKNNSKRKLAAKELGISERTLYRKIKQYDL